MSILSPRIPPDPPHPETNGPASRRHRPRPQRRRYRPLQQLTLPFPAPPQAQQLEFDFEAGYAPSVIVDNADADVDFALVTLPDVEGGAR
jgi:hypothetical protein